MTALGLSLVSNRMSDVTHLVMLQINADECRVRWVAVRVSALLPFFANASDRRRVVLQEATLIPLSLAEYTQRRCLVL